MRILIADDETVSRRKIAKIMENFGECHAVESGAQAIEAFMEAWEAWRPYDLICLDVAMPETDGMAVLYEVRRLENSKRVAEKHRVKVLMVTAHGDRDTIVTCVQAGCDDYLTKPFNLTSLRDKLEKLGLA